MDKITHKQREAAEEEIRQKAKMISYDTREYPVETIVDMFDSDELHVSLDYPLNRDWSEPQQSKFIESCLLGLPIQVFVLDRGDKLEIVDGTQRINALSAFLNNELQLCELKILQQINGFDFSNLTPARQRKFERMSIRTIVLEDKKVAWDIFERINGI